MKFENIRVYNFENALRGMRNPKNSWHLSDSIFGIASSKKTLEIAGEVAKKWAKHFTSIQKSFDAFTFEQQVFSEFLILLLEEGIIHTENDIDEYAFIGPKDMTLAKNLISAGTEHRKFLRQIFVSVDITAPLYWWKEFDTYKVGTTANSTSTMHKLDSKPITIDCFEIDDLNDNFEISEHYNFTDFIHSELIPVLENLRLKYKETKDKRYWKELVRWLPESWLQTRTVTLNYENLISIVNQRKSHKLVEWSDGFVEFANSLPYFNSFYNSTIKTS